MEECSYAIKVVLTGEFGVGKTSFVRDIVYRNFTPQPKYIDFESKTLTVKDKLVRTHIWDTCGIEKVRKLTGSYYKGASAAMLFYDITNLNTFNSLSKWLDDIHKYARPNVVIMLIGNKCDLPEAERKISTESGEDFAKQHDLLFYEMSIRNSINVDEAYMKLIEETVTKLEEIER